MDTETDVRPAAARDLWPELPLEEWKETFETLHLWTQIVGKVRVAQMPWINHSWHVPLYLSARGLTTLTIPTQRGALELEFDFRKHQLMIDTSWGDTASVDLRPRSVADFYQELMLRLENVGLDIRIHDRPNEIEDATPFLEDTQMRTYEGAYARKFWRAMVSAEQVFQKFRATFLGKCSPIHFFWGSFDLAVTRFSGRTAPEHPAGIPNLPDWVAKEAYSHECSSAGFWPGGGPHPFPLFYSYAYPEPGGMADVKVEPEAAFFSKELGEFVLPYDAVRTSESPEDTLMRFLVTTYEAAADLGGWDREGLERKGTVPPVQEDGDD